MMQYKSIVQFLIFVTAPIIKQNKKNKGMITMQINDDNILIFFSRIDSALGLLLLGESAKINMACLKALKELGINLVTHFSVPNLKEVKLHSVNANYYKPFF